METRQFFKSRRVLGSGGLRPAIVAVKDGLIEGVLDYDAQEHPEGLAPKGEALVPKDAAVVDFGDLVLMPGLVDCHVHINEPGRTEWEGFETATRAAAAGGITTLVDMPLNSSPVTTTAPNLAVKLASVKNKLFVDCGFWGGVVPGNSGDLSALLDAGVLGAKAFLIHSGLDEFPNAGEADLRLAMPILARHDKVLLVHAELDLSGGGGKRPIPHKSHYGDFLSSRPGKWEMDAIELMIRLCRETGCRVHIVHLSCADALPMIRKARAEGLPFSVETCPHYLAIHAESVPDGNTRFKCAPPIRERENADRLWEGLADGTIDFVVSDHSPCTPELKKFETGDFEEAWGGISSVQFGLPVIWTEAKARGFGPADVWRWMSRNTARFIGEPERGSLAPGAIADLVAWDPEAEFRVEASMIHYRNKMSAYEGRTLFGQVAETLRRGQTIYRNGEFSGAPVGETILHTSSHTANPERAR